MQQFAAVADASASANCIHRLIDLANAFMLLCSPAPFSSVWLCEGRCRKDGEMHQPNWSQVQAAADLDPKRTQPKIGSDRETCSHSKLLRVVVNRLDFI